MRWRYWILRFLGYDPKPRLTFRIEMETVDALRGLAERTGTDPEQLAAELLWEELGERLSFDERMALWETLTPREQQVAALICLGYTTRQIAAQLRVSPNTIKTHRQNVLRKFELPDHQALRRTLEDWDFREYRTFRG